MKILNKLTNKHLTMNKKRTIVTIIGIMLSTALMCGIGLLISTFREEAIQETIASSGDYFLRIENFPSKEISKIEEDKRISSYYTNDSLGYFILKEDIGNDYRYTTFASLYDSDNKYLSTLNLKEGRYPNNDNEIVMTKKTISYLNKKVGDEVLVTVGNLSLDGELLNPNGYIPMEAELIDGENKTFKIVGIVEIYDDWYEQGYAYTTNHKSDTTTIYLKSKSPKKIFDIASELKETYKDNELNLSYNDSLLALYGASKYNNIMKSMLSLMAIILSLISIGCIIIIYNSFAISVMERKKQFGLFASIGATKGQLRYTVFYEALIVGTIGIVLGVLASFIGIGTVIYIMNQLLKDAFTFQFKLCVYPIFLILPIIFMIFVVLFSAYSPARKASKASPIEAIRGNTDIKINKRKIKTNKLIKKIFGIEGEIALKNIKRNKKKYRITIISLVTSIVLFISFSSILNKMFDLDSFVTGINFDIVLYYTKADDASNDSYTLAQQRLNKILENEEVKSYILETNRTGYFTKTDDKIKFQKDYQELLDKDMETMEETEWSKFFEQYRNVSVILLDDHSYEEVKKQNHVKEDRPLLLNYFEAIIYSNNNRKMVGGKIFENNISSISLCDASSMVENEDYENIHFDQIKCGSSKLDNIEMIDKAPLGYLGNNQNGMTIFVNKKLYNEIYQSVYSNQKDTITGYMHNRNSEYYALYLDVDSYTTLDEYINKFKEEDTLEEYYYENILFEMKQVMNMIFVIKMLFYGFISLVTLIGVTSVFNTLNTSINLRKKEFAMLRSIGLTPKGFNRMIIFESVFFGIKSLFIGIPIALIFVYLISLTTDSISATGFVIPYASIIIATLAVFIIVLITMTYATSKIRHDNILDAIREENI